MSIEISARTAEIAYRALEGWVKLAKAEGRVNGKELPLDVHTAQWELAFAVAGSDDETTVDPPAEAVPPSPQVEHIDVATAATRLGISQQATRKRIAAGQLPARKLGRTWLVDWQEKETVNG